MSSSYEFLEGVSFPSQRHIEALRNACMQQVPKVIESFTIWRNPDSPRFSPLAGSFMHHGVSSLLFYLGVQEYRNFLEPRVVRYDNEDHANRIYLLGSPGDKQSRLKVFFRPLDAALDSPDGFLQIVQGSHDWSDEHVRNLFQKTQPPTALDWHPVNLGREQILVVQAGTIVRFVSPCTFVCMGYAGGEESFTHKDIEIEEFVVPFLQKIPRALREYHLLARKPQI